MSRTMSLKALLAISVLLMIAAPVAIAQGRVIHVDTTRNGDGSSWANAYKHLQDALFVAADGDEIWVAEGIYKPDEDLANPNGSGDQAATFLLPAGVGTYGGFPAGGGLPDERDPNAFATILCGDLNGDDAGSANKDDNSYHVVSVFHAGSSTVLGGFTITAGNANSNSSGAYGGGVYNYQADPILNNCIISGNSADKRAGGLYNRQGNPTLTNCIFSNNSSGNNGGAIYNHNSSPIIINCTFIGNSAAGSGGGINNGSDSRPEVVNCTFTANSAGSSGGAIANHLSHPSVTNCILWGNTAPAGPQISLLSSSSVSISYSDLQGFLEAIYDDGTGSTLWALGNIADNPEFKPDNYHIQPGSPCIDAGDPDRDYSGQMDIDGEPRVMGQYVDMGSDEVEAPQYFYVDDNASGDPGPGDPDIGDPLEDGSIEHPFDSIQEAIDLIGAGGTIFVMDGTYTGNGNYDIDFAGREITVWSMNGPTNCTIDCENSGRAFDFHSEETIQAIVSGFTITNGWADYGGAIRCANSSPKIMDCIITANTATNRGGGLYLNLSAATIADCVISNNSPEGIWIESGAAYLVGTIQFVSNNLAGQGSLYIQGDTTLEMHDISVFCDIFGPGTIHSGIESKLIIGGDAVLDLINPDDPNDNGTIICDGQLQVKDEVQIHNTNIVITVASFEDDTSISNSIITVNSIAPYGQLFIEPNVVVSGNEIYADGDRYMNLRASDFAGGLQNTRIFVTITEGVGQTRGGLFELRGQDGLVSHSCPPEQFLCQVAPGTIPDCDATSWTIERLELIEGAKLNLTNRSSYQPPYDFGAADEVLYVRHLILRQNSVLNTGYNRVYYETLTVEANAVITDEPLLGFSLINIAFTDLTEFIIRVIHNNFEDPADPANNRIHVQRITGSPPDPSGMMRMCNLFDESTGQVVNARAKGLFAKSDEEEVLIRLEYLFEATDPGAEMVELVVYLSDLPELLGFGYNDPNRIDHYLEVARLYPPAPGQHGSAGSEHFGVFETTVPAGDLDFIRGVRMELELTGPDGTCVLINNWDPFVACIYCGDVTGDFAISPRDYLTVLGECGGLSSGTSPQGQALYCLDGQFSQDGYVSTNDVSEWDWEQWQYSEGMIGN
ncbi:MAG: choice-of-anchor Q domain-containing protein, partial [Planctomycetota bacterium]